MLRRDFVFQSAATLAVAGMQKSDGEKLAAATRSQLGVTTSYDPQYARITYPGGDVSRSTGVCADVIVRAGRDGLRLDLQRLVHEDMELNFAAYPKAWGTRRPDSNIDHRRVLNLKTFWHRSGNMLWYASKERRGDAFEAELRIGDQLTWMLDGQLPHVAVVVATSQAGTRVVHNIGEGAQEVEPTAFQPHLAKGHYRWPKG